MANSIVLERHFVRKSAGPLLADSTRRQRVYILPTRYGLLYAVMILVMLIGGINYNNSMAYVLTFILTSLVMVGILHTYRNLAGLILTVRQPQAVFCDQDAAFPLIVDNRDQPERVSIQLQQQGKKTAAGPVQVVEIAADALLTVRLAKRMSRRGVWPYGRLRVSTTFPLGLFRAWAWFDIDTPCSVYPRPLGDQPLPESTSFDHLDHVGQQSGNDDFAGFRNYRPGDASHSIAWKHYARERDLLVKRFQGHGSRRLLLSLELVRHRGNREHSLSQLCRWVLDAEDAGARYGLR
ncbi:MAG: DUF58 domain-containing protein, partial [Thiotrichales bacterium]|nr:DUF58 domain-containing protein [Thiotrichales bacterium]